MNKLLILAAESAKYTELVEQAGLPQLEIRAASDAAPAQSLVAGCNIILGDPDLVSGVLPSADSLEWV